MQQWIVFFFGTLFVVFEYGNAQDDGSTLYSRRYEHLDIDAILASPRLVTNYVECLLNRKPCPPEGKALKRILPEALRTKCSRCWPSQKEGAIKVITKLYYDYPNQYNALRAKWDPTGEYHRRLEEYLRDQKFNVINSNGDDTTTGVQSRFDVTAAVPITLQTRSTVPAVPTRQRPVFQATVTRAPIDLTQRTTRQDFESSTQVSQDVSAFIGNRFGDDASEFDDPATKAQTARTPAATEKPRPTIRTTTWKNIQFTTTVYQTQNPILNLINRITTKFSNTAELLAGMFREAVRK